MSFEPIGYRAEGSRDGVLLMNMGGPDSPETIRPFLENLFRDREIIRFPVPAPAQRGLAWLIARVRSRKLVPVYEEMGGCSPQITHTFAQARLLGERLTELGRPTGVYVGMRYWKPFIADAVGQMVADGITRATVLPLYPQFSMTTTGSSINELSRVLERERPAIEWRWIRSWETHPGYVRALARFVRERLAEVTNGKEPVILFSAHSIPYRFVTAGDPYPNQIDATVKAVIEELGWTGPTRLAFQSRVGPIRWLEPTMPDMLATLAREGHTRVVVVPVSFVSDHIETLEEIDIQYRELATSLGFTAFARTEAPNERPEFIDALAGLVIGEPGGARSVGGTVVGSAAEGPAAP